MRVRILGLVCFLMVATLAMSQMGDPLSGSWSGDWGPSARDRNDVTLELKWDGHELSGTVNPGPNAITLKSASFDAETGVVKMTAEAPGRRGAMLQYSIEGKLEGNALTGSWSHDSVDGDFKITKN